MRKIIFYSFFSLFTSVYLTFAAANTHSLCGPLCLLEVCKQHKIDATIDTIKDYSGYTETNGTSMFGLYRAALNLGLPAVPVRVRIEQLKEIEKPCIAYVRNNHFTLIENIKENSVILRDPPDQPYEMPIKKFLEIWNGEALVFSESLTRSENQTTQQNIQNYPQLVFEKTTYDAGAIEENEKVSVSFPFRNAGDEVLKVLVTASCSCTTTLLGKNTYKKGESGELKVTIDTTGKRFRLTEKIYVTTNDPDNSLTILKVTGVIDSRIKLIPENIWLDKIETGAVIKRLIQVKHWGKEVFSITGFDNSPDITSKIVSDLSDSNTTMIEITISVPETDGHIEKQCVILTSDEKQSRLEIPIKGIVIPEFSAKPPLLFFGVAKTNEVIQKEVRIISHAEQSADFKVINSSEHITVRLVDTDNPTNHTLMATLTCPSFTTTVKDTIRVFASDDAQPVVEIPCFSQVK